MSPTYHGMKEAFLKCTDHQGSAPSVDEAASARDLEVHLSLRYRERILGLASHVQSRCQGKPTSKAPHPGLWMGLVRTPCAFNGQTFLPCVLAIKYPLDDLPRLWPAAPFDPRSRFGTCELERARPAGHSRRRASTAMAFPLDLRAEARGNCKLQDVLSGSPTTKVQKEKPSKFKLSSTNNSRNPTDPYKKKEPIRQIIRSTMGDGLLCDL